MTAEIIPFRKQSEHEQNRELGFAVVNMFTEQGQSDMLRAAACLCDAGDVAAAGRITDGVACVGRLIREMEAGI